ncbi:MAG: hypothetical protein KAR16_02365 [Bacteroidales bacterium]|nr:hypothetical protein [Bacteroidales bacterium]
MKTFRTILIIVGVALTTITFGQLLSQTDGSILFYTVAYNSVNNRLEHRLDQFPERRVSCDQFEAPVAARTYFVPLETDLAVESWMTTPFETNYYEVEPFIESWMVSPFECNFYEMGPSIESWMTSPFESSVAEAELNLESWMASPFNCNVAEADLLIETWMTVPFDAAESIEMESWMTADWI